MDYISQNDVLEWLKTHLDEERFEHSLGVSETAVELAERFGLDKDKAYCAGILHDCAKCLPADEQEDIIRSSLSIQECEMINPKTYHAPIGAYIAETVFDVKDEEILSAIRWHTIGKLDMSNFEKIIFIADKIEPRTRPDEYINLIKPRLSEPDGLNKALLECYKGTIKSLAERELKICITTIEIYNELLTKYEKN
ncbi:MAG: bis(5'-nucleosyl)-tetraphosphatase (symmetrical) YqeK [Candidatus Gastranaerophilales bacterium]|nr:bis(5'-nucleosyl)-tetraphosphatase (symmetrical) YqeK [Candidatus Gastranaerophilales bacterium]